MKLTSVNLEAQTAVVEWNGKTREVKFTYGSAGAAILIPVAGRVGRTGSKLWNGHQSFWNKDGEWRRGSASGGINMKAFTPVCFRDDVPETMACKR